jgi:cytoskeletal protein RodZ
MTGDKNSPDSEKLTSEIKPSGLDLKALREARGLSLRDIYKQTRVSVVNLEAIETENFHLLPAPAYGKTFIKAYAEAIDIDSKILLGAYENYLQSLNIAEEHEKVRRKATQKNRKRYHQLIWFILLIVLVGGVILALSLHYQCDFDIFRSQTPQPVRQKTDATAIDSAIPVTPTIQAEKTDQTKPEMGAQSGQVMADQTPLPPRPEFQTGVTTKPAMERDQAVPADQQTVEREETYHLIIEARELTWIRIKADHNQSSQMILKPGQKIERFASDRFVVDVGNAAGIDVTFQGRSRGNLGEQGQVVHLTLP